MTNAIQKAFRCWIVGLLLVSACNPAAAGPPPTPPPAHLTPPSPVSFIKGSLIKQASEEISSIYRRSAISTVVIESPPAPVLAGVWDGEDQSPNETSPRATEESEPDLSETASGIIFSEERHILTNHHVIQNVLSDYVKVKLKDGRLFRAKIVGSDSKTDIAVLQLPELENPPPPLPRGNSDFVEVGDFVCAIGSPYGLEYTLTVGIVSGRGRNPLTFSAYEDYIQTDAAINPGNSGGPLLNSDGDWVGVNTLINGINRGLGFAVPSNQAIKIANEIIDRGTVLRPWVGFRVVANPTLGENSGLEISWVSQNSPASRAGIKPKDIVVSVSGETVKSPAELQKKIWEAGVGGQISMEIRRGKSTKTRKLRTVEMPQNEWVH